MGDGTNITPKLVRYPMVPMEYDVLNDASIPGEILFDPLTGKLMIKKTDGTFFTFSPDA